MPDRIIVLDQGAEPDLKIIPKLAFDADALFPGIAIDILLQKRDISHQDAITVLQKEQGFALDTGSAVIESSTVGSDIRAGLVVSQ